MSIGLLFWVLMILWLVLGLYGGRAKIGSGDIVFIGGGVLLFVLLFLLGWHSFGFIIHD